MPHRGFKASIFIAHDDKAALRADLCCAGAVKKFAHAVHLQRQVADQAHLVRHECGRGALGIDDLRGVNALIVGAGRSNADPPERVGRGVQILCHGGKNVHLTHDALELCLHGFRRGGGLCAELIERLVLQKRAAVLRRLRAHVGGDAKGLALHPQKAGHGRNA